jgi:hypothetical protein
MVTQRKIRIFVINTHFTTTCRTHTFKLHKQRIKIQVTWKSYIFLKQSSIGPGRRPLDCRLKIYMCTQSKDLKAWFCTAMCEIGFCDYATLQARLATAAGSQATWSGVSQLIKIRGQTEHRTGRSNCTYQPVISVKSMEIQCTVDYPA